MKWFCLNLKKKVLGTQLLCTTKISFHNFRNAFTKLWNIFVQIMKYIWAKFKICLSKVSKIFFQSVKYICPLCQIYLSEVSNIFVQSVKYICPKCQIYLSKHFHLYFCVKHFLANSAQSILLEGNQRRRLGYLQVICGQKFKNSWI